MTGSKLTRLNVHKVDFVDRGANPDAEITLFKRKDEKPPSKVTSFFREVAKKLSLSQADADEAVIEIEKAAETFGEKLIDHAEERKNGAIWQLCYALQESVGSILQDQTVTDKATLVRASLLEFHTAANKVIDLWADITGVDDVLDAITKSDGQDDDEKEEEIIVNVDKSKLTQEEVAQLDAIIKKAGAPEDPKKDEDDITKDDETKDKKDAVAKSVEMPAELKAEYEAELARIKKMADGLEERELTEVAKRFEVLGKKTEDLVPVLKSLKASNTAAYDHYVSVLNESLVALNKSKAFEEVGRNGHGVNQPWEAIEKRAGEIMAANPALNRHQAIVQAGVENPQLVAEYEGRA